MIWTEKGEALEQGERYAKQVRPGERFATRYGQVMRMRRVDPGAVVVELEGASDFGFERVMHISRTTVVVDAPAAGTRNRVKTLKRAVQDGDRPASEYPKKVERYDHSEGDAMAERLLAENSGKSYKEIRKMVMVELPGGLAWSRTDKWMANLAFYMRKDGRLPPLVKGKK